MIKSILLIFFGAIFFLGSITSFITEPSTLENIEVVQGELITVQGVEDKEFGIKSNAPILFRHVEMMQNISESKKDYADTPVKPSVKVKDGEDKDSTKNIQRRELFENPPFPSLGGKTYFTGTVTVGKNGLKVSPELLKALLVNGYHGFQKGPYKKQLTNLPDPVDKPLDDLKLANIAKPLEKHFINKGDYYATNDDEKKLGHTRVTYYVGQPQGIFTVAGTVKDGVIGVGPEPSYLFDGPRTKKEITDKYDATEESMQKASYVLVVVGGVMLFFGVRRILRRRKENA